MEYKKNKSQILLQLDRGEEVISSILSLAEKEQIQCAQISAIGAADRIEIGLYNVEQKQYKSSVFAGDFEILSCEGNLSQNLNKPYLHLHLSFGDEKHQVYGGHLNYCRISGTFECVINLIDIKVDRKKDEVTGLNVWKF